jgi:ADP-heptose:LPS heptosyltransferase
VDARLRGLDRVVAFTGPGPLADRVRALGGAAVAPPGAGLRGGPHALEVLGAGLLAATGLEAAGPPSLAATEDERARGRALAGAGEYVVVHPGAGARERRWPLPRFLALLAAAPCAGVLVTGPVEEEWPLEPAALPPGARRLGPLPLADLCALLAGARACAANDSGPGHLAAGLGVPVLSLFGAADPGVWAPRGRAPVRVVQGVLARLPVEAALPAWRGLLGLDGPSD